MVRRSKRLRGISALAGKNDNTNTNKPEAKCAQPAVPTLPVSKVPKKAPIKSSSTEKHSAIIMPKTTAPLRGRCKSGRVWKKPSQKRSSARTVRVTKGGAFGKLTPFEVRARKKRKHNRMRELQANITEERKQRKRAERTAQEEKERRRADAEWRTGNFQIVTNGNKIKKMSKRQLRKLRKISVDADGTKRLVNPWTGEVCD